jgi:hypothetical protein
MAEGILLTSINLIVSASVLLFIIWDHLKDDRQLTRQIQEFYNDIEMLIYTFIQVKYYNAIEKKEIDVPDQKILNKTRNRDIIQNSYLKIKIRNNFDNFSNYLGLTNDEEAKSYLNNTIFILTVDGLLKKRDFEKNDVSEVIFSYTDIKKEELEYIQKFLNSLRFYWNKHFKKPVFRTQLKAQLNFGETLGISIPLEKKPRRGKLLAKKIL